jgi:hypothetical protein
LIVQSAFTITFHQLTVTVDHGSTFTPFIDVIDNKSPSKSVSLLNRLTITGVFSIVLELSLVAIGGLFDIFIVIFAASLPPCQSVIV